MSKISEEFANATAVAGGFISIHLFKMLIEKGLLSVEDGTRVLGKAHNDVARAMRIRNLDTVLIEAEEIVSALSAKLHNGADPSLQASADRH